MHGEVKLRNIMVMNPAKTVLIDFGSSDIFDDIPNGLHLHDIDDLVWACLDVPKLAKAVRTWIATHLNDPMLEGLPYQVLPFDPSRHIEDDLPIIALVEEENG